MDQGAKVDIVTGRPIRAFTEKQIEKAQTERRELERKSSDLGITRGADGIRLIEIVRESAVKRLEILATQDSEMKAYLDILSRLGDTESVAARAYQKLSRIKNQE